MYTSDAADDAGCMHSDVQALRHGRASTMYLRADLSNRQVLSVAIRHQERAIAASGAKSAIHGSQPGSRK